MVKEITATVGRSVIAFTSVILCVGTVGTVVVVVVGTVVVGVEVVVGAGVVVGVVVVAVNTEQCIFHSIKI